MTGCDVRAPIVFVILSAGPLSSAAGRDLTEGEKGAPTRVFYGAASCECTL